LLSIFLDIFIAHVFGYASNETFAEITKYLTSPEVGPAIGFLLVLIIVTSLLGKGKGKISSGRFVGKAEKLQATSIALKQIGNNKCQPCTLWSGTPNYWFGKKYRGISSRIQTVLNSPPTTYFPHAERGMLVIGAPGSGKTFSVIDRAIESAFRQGFSMIIYDKKGDQILSIGSTNTVVTVVYRSSVFNLSINFTMPTVTSKVRQMGKIGCC
jgi:type IV secretion system protein VirD4